MVFDKDPQQLPGLPMNGGDIEAWAKARRHPGKR